MVSPFLFLALPAMFFVGGTAVFFESVTLLRGGFGNVFYFFAFTADLVDAGSNCLAETSE